MTRIHRIETFVLKLDASETYLGPLTDGTVLSRESGYRVRKPWRSLYSPLFETLLVKVTDEDGTSGWGEALTPVGPEVLASIVDKLIAPALVGTEFTGPRAMWSTARDLMRERGHLVGHQADALAAVDIAMWDLAGQVSGLPIHALLGGAFRTEIPVYVSGLPRSKDSERAELAIEWVAHGATAVKLHLGQGVDADIATVDAISAAAPDLRIAVDAHWAYDLFQATRLGTALQERGVLFLEAPLAPEDIEGHRDLAGRLGLPVAVGEALRNRYEFEAWISSRALGLAQPDVARTGITEAMSIVELAAARHLPVAAHHSVGLGVAMAAGIQVTAAIENTPFFEFQPTTFEVAQRILATPLKGGGAGFTLPTGPGLGIEVDEEFVAHAALAPGA